MTANGGSVTIGVSTTRDCSWNASSDQSWLRLSTASGQGETTFTANVDANPQAVSRSANITVNAQRVGIVQEARPCTFTLAEPAAQFDASGGSGRVAVTTLAGCSWRATSNVGWIQVPATAVSGSGGLNFQVAPNDGSERSGVITVGDAQLVVTQAQNPLPGTTPGPGPTPLPNCAASVAPLTVDASAAASTQTLQLTIGPTCSWSATSNASWLTITSPSTGTGTATIDVSVAANPGAERAGTVTVAGQAVTVRQTALSCTFTLSPSSQTFAAGGGSGSLNVSTQAACAWTASTSVSWITLTTSSGTGSGSVNFTVQANTTTATRSATVSVGGQTFTVSQAAAACAFSVSPSSLNVAADGGHNRITVTTASNCAWTAVAGAPWVNLSNQAGTGTGDVNFNVQANTSTAARSTTITAGGQTVTINQAAGVACTYTINPTSANIAAAGASGQFTVTTQVGCTWSAVSGAPWVTVTAPAGGNGTGTADVAFTVQPNPDTAARTTTITVGGQSYTVNQSAAEPQCTYTLNPTSGSFTSAAGPGTFTVSTQAGCTWTATTQDGWITVNSSSGTGSGDVSFALQANATGASRSGTITVAGKTYSVTQAP